MTEVTYHEAKIWCCPVEKGKGIHSRQVIETRSDIIRPVKNKTKNQRIGSGGSCGKSGRRDRRCREPASINKFMVTGSLDGRQLRHSVGL